MECGKCGYVFTGYEEDDMTFGWQCPYCLYNLCGKCAEQMDGVKNPICPSCECSSG